VAGSPDFVDVYQAHLTGVWRYVRFRIPYFGQAGEK
jgi:hypothetical protein